MAETRVVIVGYKPFEGKEELLKKLVLNHYDRLLGEGLVTSRKPVILEAQNGCILEIFEWKSKEVIEEAHTNVEVQQMWGEFAAVCEYIPAGDLPEMTELFSEFTPI